MPNAAFYIMSFFLRCRDLVRPRERILEEVDIRPGNHVLDFGCAHGSYTFLVSESVGPGGKVYAQDILQLALDAVRKKASRLKLNNITAVCSDCSTGISDETIDVVLFYDVFHLLGNPEAILKEIRRILKPDGIVSFSDHHMSEEKIISGMIQGDMFWISEKGKHTYSFKKS